MYNLSRNVKRARPEVEFNSGERDNGIPVYGANEKGREANMKRTSRNERRKRERKKLWKESRKNGRNVTGG